VLLLRMLQRHALWQHGRRTLIYCPGGSKDKTHFPYDQHTRKKDRRQKVCLLYYSAQHCSKCESNISHGERKRQYTRGWMDRRHDQGAAGRCEVTSYGERRRRHPAAVYSIRLPPGEISGIGKSSNFVTRTLCDE